MISAKNACLFAAFAGMIVSACGGSSGATSDLFGPGAATVAGADAGPAAQSDATIAEAGLPPTTSDGSVPVDPVDATGDDDAAETAPPKDAAVDQATMNDGVACGPMTCVVPQKCCQATLPFMSFNCSSGTTCPILGELAIPCDDAEDCAAAGRPNAICCGEGTVDILTQNFRITAVACRNPGACNDKNNRILCDEKTPNGCPGNLKCADSKDFPGYKLCVN